MNEIARTDPLLQKTYGFQENCDIKTIQVKRVTDTSIWVMSISKNIDTLEIEHSLLLSFPAMDFISGRLILLTNPIHRIPCQFVNKPGKRLLCYRVLLTKSVYKNSYTHLQKMALSPDDKLLGEKVHYYCSSSEDSGDEDSGAEAGDDEACGGAKSQQQAARFIPEPDLKDYTGHSTNVSILHVKYGHSTNVSILHVKYGHSTNVSILHVKYGHSTNLSILHVKYGHSTNVSILHVKYGHSTNVSILHVKYGHSTNISILGIEYMGDHYTIVSILGVKYGNSTNVSILSNMATLLV